MRPCENTQQFFEKAEGIGGDLGKAPEMLFNEINNDLEGSWNHIRSQQEKLEQSLNEFKTIVYKTAVLWKIQRLTGGYRSFGTAGRNTADNEMYISQPGAGVIQEGLLGARISYIGGVVPSDQIAQFKRLIVRATRCQVFVHAFDLHIHTEDQLLSDPYHVRKSIFVLCFQDGSVVEDKLRRICNSFTGAIFEVKLDGIDEEIAHQ